MSFVLTGGQRNDAAGFESVWEGAPALPGLGAVVMDKAYGSNTIRQFLAMQGIEVVIPSKANRTESMHIAWSAGDVSEPGAVQEVDPDNWTVR